jgi:hypothetical protein
VWLFSTTSTSVAQGLLLPGVMIVAAFLNSCGGSADPMDEWAYFVPAHVAEVVGFD